MAQPCVNDDGDDDTEDVLLLEITTSNPSYHRFALAFALDHERDHDQVACQQGVLAHQRAGEGVTAHAAHADGGEAHGGYS